MTYKEIQKKYRLRNNKSISTCKIADAKRRLGFNVKISKNRINPNIVQRKANEYEIREIAIILEKQQ